MEPRLFLEVVDDALRLLVELGGPLPTDDARRMLLCIALQESGPTLTARYQGSPAADPGPARGFFQFEAGGGCRGVLTHRATTGLAQQLCAEYAVVAEQNAVWRALEGHDLLAVGFARLLLYTDAAPLPRTAAEGWDCYLRTWRPGAPHPETWPDNWATADAAVRDSG